MTDGQNYNGPGRVPRKPGLRVVGGDDGGSPAAGGRDLDLDLSRRAHTDLGNAHRLRARFGDRLRHTCERGWLAYDLVRWQAEDGDGAAAMLAQDAAEAIVREARTAEAANAIARPDLEALYAHAKQSQNRARIDAMLTLSEPRLRARIEDFDTVPDLLNTPAGTLELGPAGSPGDLVLLRPHDRDDMITRCTAAAFDPAAEAPMFLAFLKRTVPDDEVRLFVQRLFGYAATGDTGEQVMGMFYGRGANGKSVLLNVIRAVLGDYVMTIPFASLTDESRRGGGDATPDLARLPGARLVLASEPKVGTRLDEGIIKALTGGEPLQVRAMYREPFEMLPHFKIIVSFNNKPKIFGQDEGTWRRIAMVPFEVTIPAAERDPRLAEKIIAVEAAGVLNWILDGVRLYRERGLDVPAAVRDATEAYRGESDPVGPFLAAATVRADGGRLPSADLYQAYEIWARRNGVEAVGRTRFGRILTEKNFERSKQGVMSYLDVELTADYQAALEAARGGGERAAAGPVATGPYGEPVDPYAEPPI